MFYVMVSLETEVKHLLWWGFFISDVLSLEYIMNKYKYNMISRVPAVGMHVPVADEEVGVVLCCLIFFAILVDVLNFSLQNILSCSVFRNMHVF